MTAYLVSSTLQTVAIRAVTYELRITQVTASSLLTAASLIITSRHEGSTLSGGSAADIMPLYQGAPAASATANHGTSLTFSGTNRFLASTILSNGANTQVIGYTPVTTAQGANAQIISPLTLTIAPGSVFHVTHQFSGPLTRIFFEEIRLAGSY